MGTGGILDKTAKFIPFIVCSDMKKFGCSKVQIPTQNQNKKPMGHDSLT